MPAVAVPGSLSHCPRSGLVAPNHRREDVARSFFVAQQPLPTHWIPGRTPEPPVAPALEVQRQSGLTTAFAVCASVEMRIQCRLLPDSSELSNRSSCTRGNASGVRRRIQCHRAFVVLCVSARRRLTPDGPDPMSTAQAASRVLPSRDRDRGPPAPTHCRTTAGACAPSGAARGFNVDGDCAAAAWRSGGPTKVGAVTRACAVAA